MKKYMLVLAMLGIMPVIGANGYEYSDDSAQYVVTRSDKSGSYKKTSNVRKKTGGYHNTITNNFYYTGQPMQMPTQAPIQRRAPLEYNDNNDYVAYEEPVEQKRVVRETRPARSSQERRYFLAHPFFQPLKGKIGSVTDLSYAKNTFKFDILNAGFKDLENGTVVSRLPLGYTLNGKAKTSQLVVKEDLSFGLTDSLALMLMAQYDKTKVNIGDYVTNNPTPDDLSDNTMSSSGVNIFGIGLQNRFIDNDEWIAMFSGFFQHQKDAANSLVFDAKAGYKMNRTTLYGLARLGYSNLINGDTYGAFWEDPSGDWLMLSYKQNIKDVVYVEGGVGAFSVLNKYTYLGGELIYGYYDWHNQLNIKGTFGFQPSEHFALSLYGSVSLYDSAKGKTRGYMEYDVNPDIPAAGLSDGVNTIAPGSTSLLYATGDYKINSYNEWKIGVQAILYF